MDVAVEADHACTPENPARQQTDERWRTAFENSAIGITMADFSGRFFAANSAFLNLLGYTETSPAWLGKAFLFTRLRLPRFPTAAHLRN